MNSAPETFRSTRRKRRTAIRAYGKVRAELQLELKREVKLMTTAEVLRWLATWPPRVAGTFALIFFGFAIGMVLG